MMLMSPLAGSTSITSSRASFFVSPPSSEPTRGRAPANPLTMASGRSEEHTSELQSHLNLVCRLLLEKKIPALQTTVLEHPGRLLTRDLSGIYAARTPDH